MFRLPTRMRLFFSAPPRPLSPDFELLMAGMTTENHTINSQTDNSSEHIIHTKTVSDCVNAEPKTLDKWIRKQTRVVPMYLDFEQIDLEL